uniref:ATP-dependent Clp protease proteolytic subunit n=1 Tax=Ravenala madagascariensis TaxID=4664 RepID=U6A4I5_9LILI|nr:clp protease proteolytic subunit [Ravenala madagascariensis]AHA12624.1 clp protease proteolytic subunit [Ravenala madagascariensis]
MPVGVPKLPFQTPTPNEEEEEEDAIWLDLYNRLHRERLLFLCQDIDNEISNNIVGLMVCLSLEDHTRNQHLFINCPGGGVISGIAIHDTMQTVLADVYTICMGIAASMGSVILIGGRPNKRIAFPHARVMIHQPISSFLRERIGDLSLELKEIQRLRGIIISLFLKRTNIPLWLIEQKIERDVYMSATEAQARGIIDYIGITTEYYENETTSDDKDFHFDTHDKLHFPYDKPRFDQY